MASRSPTKFCTPTNRSTARSTALAPYPPASQQTTPVASQFSVRRLPVTHGGYGHKWHANRTFRLEEQFVPLKMVLASSQDILSFYCDANEILGGNFQVIP
jgi:hypothetical protein